MDSVPYQSDAQQTAVRRGVSRMFYGGTFNTSYDGNGVSETNIYKILHVMSIPIAAVQSGATAACWITPAQVPRPARLPQ